MTVPKGSKINCIYSYSEDGELMCEVDGDVCDGSCKVHEPPTVKENKMRDLIVELNSKIGQINTANFNLHKESGDLQDWLDRWHTEVGSIVLSLHSLIESQKVLLDTPENMEKVMVLWENWRMGRYGNDNQRD